MSKIARLCQINVKKGSDRKINHMKNKTIFCFVILKDLNAAKVPRTGTT
ncbi:hypothetical protein SB521682_1890 [Shigella boydii 5216-82]|nr:hypothetical protein SB521682_1890 [Shigella boydii 5216-82]